MVIGGILSTMVVLTLVCLLLWTGIVPAPYEPGFSSAKDEATPVAQPCPPADAVTVEVTSVPVNVYNGTDTTGLAGDVTTALTESGLTVTTTADWPRGSYDGNVLLTTSQAGITNAYTLARVFTGTVNVTIDETADAADPAVSVVLGSEYKQSILTTSEIGQLKAGTPISAPTSCVAVTNAPSDQDSPAPAS
nr:LytR C-terminal domain-containing protein [Actinomyces faecalis]